MAIANLTLMYGGISNIYSSIIFILYIKRSTTKMT